MGANPSRSPLAVIPPASSTAARFASNSGWLKSDTWWPCWAKSNADASPPLPAPSTATRITARAYPSRRAHRVEQQRRDDRPRLGSGLILVRVGAVEEMAAVDERRRSAAVEVDRVARTEGDQQPGKLAEVETGVDARA